MLDNFSEKILELRREKGYSQQQVASACKTTQETVSRWETGTQEPKISYLVPLASLFEVSTDYLLGLETDYGTKEEN